MSWKLIVSLPDRMMVVMGSACADVNHANATNSTELITAPNRLAIFSPFSKRIHLPARDSPTLKGLAQSRSFCKAHTRKYFPYESAIFTIESHHARKICKATRHR